MTEKEELAKLEKRRKQIEAKYNKIAKKRLTELNKIISPDASIVDMTDKDFKEKLLPIVKAEVDFYNQHYAEYQQSVEQARRRQQQQRNQQNYQQQ